jgi:hypothetical protein
MSNPGIISLVRFVLKIKVEIVEWVLLVLIYIKYS